MLAFFFLASCSEKDEITDLKPAVTLLNHAKTEYLGCFIDSPIERHLNLKYNHGSELCSLSYRLCGNTKRFC